MFAGVRREMAARLSLRALFCYVQWRWRSLRAVPPPGKTFGTACEEELYEN